jgi:glutamyl/glutaminyl-tRNA synthetase
MNSDGTKLSKRQNDLHLSALRDRGILAPALLNFVTLVGGGFQAVFRIPYPVSLRILIQFFLTSIRIRIQSFTRIKFLCAG